MYMESEGLDEVLQVTDEIILAREHLLAPFNSGSRRSVEDDYYRDRQRC